MPVDTTPFGEIASLKRGISWDASQERDPSIPGTFPVLGIPNIQDRLVLDKVVHLQVPGGRPAPTQIADRGTILMVGSNGNPDRVGNAVLIQDDRGFLFASFLVGARVRDPSRTDPRFLFHFLSSPGTQDALTRSVRGTTGLKNLSQRFVESILVPRFPLAEQHQIAEILDTLDEAIRKTEQIIAKLQQVKQGLLHDLLTRGIDDNGELRDPDRHPEQFKESALGRIPASWDLASVADLGTVVTGRTPPTSDSGAWGEDLPFITPAELEASGRIVKAERYVSRRGRRHIRELPAGTILVVCIGSTIGKIGLSPWSCCTNQQINAVLCSDAHVPTFVYGVLRQHIHQIHRWAGLQAVPIVNKSQFGRMLVPVAPPREQEAIADQLSAMDASSVAEVDTLSKLRLLKSGLMEDLLTGRVRVTKLLEQAAE